MKIVISRRNEGFSLLKFTCKMLGLSCPYIKKERTDPALIDCIETLKKNANKEYAFLEVVTIPNDVTDYDIIETNGTEIVIYVLNGKIHCV